MQLGGVNLHFYKSLGYLINSRAVDASVYTYTYLMINEF